MFFPQYVITTLIIGFVLHGHRVYVSYDIDLCVALSCSVYAHEGKVRTSCTRLPEMQLVLYVMYIIRNA
jgi:hypothetical protein